MNVEPNNMKGYGGLVGIFYLTISLLAFCGGSANAQCNITLNGNIGGAVWNSFDTYADVLSGETFDEFITLSYSASFGENCPGWKLRVKTLGNFTNGSATIAPQYVSIRFNRVSQGNLSAAAIGVTNTAVALSTSDVTLINSNAAFTAPPDYYTAHKFDMLVAGGSHLLVGSGTYTATLRFTLYNSSNVAVSTKDFQASFNVVYSNSCTGVTMSFYQSAQNSFTNYAQQMGGATVTDAINLQYAPNGATCRGWTLKVRAAGNFVNGANTVSPNFFSLRFNRVVSGSPSAANIGVSNTAVVPLSNSDAVLINNSGDSFNGGTVHRFDMLIQGGNHLLVPNGTYTASFIFSLYNQANQLISTATNNVVFQINSNVSSYTVELQNAANTVDMVFTPALYDSGISISKLRGLKVTGYTSHQILVKTSTANLTSGSNTIPVGAVSLETTKYTSTAAGIVCYTRALSAADQVIANNPVSNYTQQVVEYDLRYYTAPGDSRFSTQSGVYTTNVIFIAIPN